MKRIIEDSEILKEDDNLWPRPDRVGRQELEVVLGEDHISFTTSKIGSLIDVNQCKDPEGLRTFYYLVQGHACFFATLSLRSFGHSFDLNKKLIVAKENSSLENNLKTRSIKDLKCLVFSLIGLHFKIKPI